MESEQLKNYSRAIKHKGDLWGVFDNINQIEDYTFDCKFQGKTVRIKQITKLKKYKGIPHPIPYLTPCVINKDKRKTDNLAKKIVRATEKRYEKLFSKLQT